ncbi:hypothetical protein PMAYCL1PPCAC_30087, partial [Pristionchus mayeri]
GSIRPPIARSHSCPCLHSPHHQRTPHLRIRQYRRISSVLGGTDSLLRVCSSLQSHLHSHIRPFHHSSRLLPLISKDDQKMSRTSATE